MQQKVSGSWRSYLTVTVLAAFFYVFMEWLFIVTKPSFMNLLSIPKKIEILLFSASVIAILCMLAVAPLILLSLLPGIKAYRRWLIRLGLLAPAVVLASSGLLLVDNFTYTVFRFGIVSTQGAARGLYAVLWLALLFLAYRSLVRSLNPEGHPQGALAARKGLQASILGVLLFSCALPVINKDAASRVIGSAAQTARALLPHIILITSDGMEASHLSLYGYARDTSPRLSQLAETSLVAENNFSNSDKTAGSVVSIYTGKYPAQSRFFYPPNILRDANAYEHLPGILHSLGYFTIQIAPPYYVDAFTYNLLGGFDVANGQKASTSKFLTAMNKYLSNDFSYFFYELSNRIFDRLRHIFYLKEMRTSVDTVMNPKDFNDPQKMDELIGYLENAKQPLFIHIHLMGTHGDKFSPTQQTYSKGQSEQTQGIWNQDFYDDSILDTDHEVGKIVDRLKGLKLLDHTILIVGADHGEQWTENHRIPLVIHFPQGQYAGKVPGNVQNLDIAPTILDYLGVPKPGWMNGQSLLHLPAAQRPIISNGPIPIIFKEMPTWEGPVLDEKDIKPPFYDLGVIDVVYCQKWYKLNLYTRAWSTGEVVGSTNTCASQDLLSNQSALQLMLDHLKKYGYDVASLETLQLPAP